MNAIAAGEALAPEIADRISEVRSLESSRASVGMATDPAYGV